MLAGCSLTPRVRDPGRGQESPPRPALKQPGNEYGRGFPDPAGAGISTQGHVATPRQILQMRDGTNTPSGLEHNPPDVALLGIANEQRTIGAFG